MKKKCEIRTSLPVTCFTVPIVGCTELMLTSDEIRKCLCAKAEVTEILSDGRRIPLDFSNYDKNNCDNIEIPTIIKIEEEPVIEVQEEVIVEEFEEITETEVVEEHEEIIETVEESEIVEEQVEEVITEEIESEEVDIIPQIADTDTTAEEPKGNITVAKAPVAKTVTASNKGNYKKAKNNNKR